MLNKIHQILYYLYPAKEITKKVYNNILSSIKLQNKMDTIFLNSGYSKIPDPHRLLIKLSDKIPLKKKSGKYLALSNLRIYYAWKKI